MTDATLAFFATHSSHSDPHGFAWFYEAVPADWAGLCRWVRNVVSDVYDAAEADPPLPAARQQDRRVRRVAEILERIAAALASDPTDLDAVRQLYARPDLGVPGEVVCYPHGEPERAAVV